MITAHELAKLLDQTPQTIRRWIDEGLPAKRGATKDRWVMDQAAAMAWVRQYKDLSERRRNGGKRAGAGAKKKHPGTRAGPRPGREPRRRAGVPAQCP